MGNLLPFTGRCGIELASGNGVFIAGRVPARKAAARKTEPVSASLWAFLGTDDLRVKEAALAKSRELGEAAGEFGLEMIEGAADNSEHAVRIVASVIESLQTLPFFGGGKVVWLKGATFLADTVTGRAQSTLDALERLAAVLGTLPPDVQFLLSASEVVGGTGGQSGGTAGRRVRSAFCAGSDGPVCDDGGREFAADRE